MAANLVCKLRMQSINIIEYAFYEKPITSNRTLQSDTALNQNRLIKSLANEVDSFSETVDVAEKKAALDRFSKKLTNSGHNLTTVRSILVSDIKGYKWSVARCKEQRTPCTGLPLQGGPRNC